MHGQFTLKACQNSEIIVTLQQLTSQATEGFLQPVEHHSFYIGTCLNLSNCWHLHVFFQKLRPPCFVEDDAEKKLDSNCHQSTQVLLLMGLEMLAGPTIYASALSLLFQHDSLDLIPQQTCVSLKAVFWIFLLLGERVHILLGLFKHAGSST